MTNLKLFQGKLHPEDFKNTTHVEYGTYKFSANKRKHEFSISKSYNFINFNYKCCIRIFYNMITVVSIRIMI